MIKLNPRQHDPGQPDGGTTAAPGPSPFSSVTLDALAAAKAMIAGLGPPPPEVEFVAAPFLGKGWVAVLVGGHPVDAWPPETFEAFKTRLKETKTDG